MYNFALLVFLLIDLEIYSCASIQNEENESNWDKIVKTSDGKVGGYLHVNQNLNMTHYAFRSIPYAKPPVGERRFKDPEAIDEWTGVLNATKIPKACPQPLLAESEMSEDCLFLNIFVPSPWPSSHLPVIFWIHGGYFQIGDGSLSNTSPDLLVNENVIVVSINYRLGVFGFLSAGDDVLPGNYGIKDQIMALQWVHKNIAKFGGKTSKITIMGQSAGAANVGLLLQAPAAEGLFSAAILQSGNSLNLWSRSTNAKSITKRVASHFKIKYNTTQDLISELQKIEWTEFLTGASAVFVLDIALSNPFNGVTFGPTIDSNETSALMGRVHENFKRGVFNRVPILIGYNSGEGNMFNSLFTSLPTFLKSYDTSPKKLAPSNLNVNSSVLKEIGEKVKSFYFGSESITASKESFSNFIADHEFIRPAHEFVRLLSKYKETYFYRFAYVGQLPVVDDTQRELKGAVHCEELQYLFYSTSENSATAADLITRSRLVKLWTNFAKHHNPTPFVDPLFQNITWKRVHPHQINYLDIDSDLRMLENPNEESINFWTSIYDTYGVPPYDTY